MASAHTIPLDTLQLNGTAAVNTAGHITLTTHLYSAGSAFVPAPYTFGPSTTSQPADGLAFIVQNTGAGPAYLGFNGSGLGFFGNGITGSSPGTLAIAAPVGLELAQTIPSLAVFGGSGPAGPRYVWVPLTP
jgi:hypothetical protein